MEKLLQDLRFGMRSLARTPVFASVAILTLGLGLAAMITVVSFMDALFLRSLPVPNAKKLVSVSIAPYGSWTVSYRQYLLFRDQNRSFEDLAAHYSTAPLYVDAGTIRNEVTGAIVTWNYFPVLGIKPELGRFFLPEEDSVRMRNPVAVISHNFWQSRFQGDPKIVGRTFTINATTFEIVGVAPKGFAGIEMGVSPNEIWIPAMMLPVGYRFCDSLSGDQFEQASQPGDQRWECGVMKMMGVLKPGVSAEQAASEFQSLRRGAIRPGFQDTSEPLVVRPLRGVRDIGRRFFSALAQRMTIVAALLMLIACANVAGLLVARGAARTREIATRMAIGAGRSRLIRQLLTETMLLAIGGCAVGLFLSQWSSRALMSFYANDSEGYPRYFDLHTDSTVLVSAIGLTLLTAILAGLLPALLGVRRSLATALQLASSRVSTRGRTQALLVAAQVTLTFTLLVAMALLVRSVGHIENGGMFDPTHVAGLRLRPRLVGYSPTRAQAFTREAVRRVETLPGVESVSLAAAIGFVWAQGLEATLSLPGQPRSNADTGPKIHYREVSPKYFATLNIPIRRGRDFNDSDTPDAPLVTIVNETLAQRVWKTTDVLGRAMIVDGKTFRVAGVVRDGQISSDLDGPTAVAYFAYWQNVFAPQVDSRLAVRVHGDPRAMLPAIAQAIGEVDPQVPITERSPLLSQVRGEFVDLRVATAVLSCAGVVALFLSALGLYSMISFAVAQKTREIGIRVALGARSRQVTGLFVRHAMRTITWGVLAGFLISLFGGRLLAAWLFGVTATDPTAFMSAVGAILFAALLAAYLAARRASRVDPMVALRYD